MTQRRREGWIAFASATAAVLLAGTFTVWALTASAYSTGETLLEVNQEPVVRIVVWAPLAVTLVTWVLLHVACRYGSERAKLAGSILAGLLLTLAYIAGFSIGLLFLPAATALVLAAAVTPTQR